jgi:hypothetical protein
MKCEMTADQVLKRFSRQIRKEDAAFVGGLFVLLAQLLANWAQRERDRQTERQALTGTLRAIQAEVLVLRADFLMPLWDLLKAAEPGPFPTMPVQKNFFVVFESKRGRPWQNRDSSRGEVMCMGAERAEIHLDRGSAMCPSGNRRLD